MGSHDTHADLVAALAKGVVSCECEHISHDAPGLEAQCAPAVEEIRTHYGRFTLCAACLDAEHMQMDEGSQFDPDDDMVTR